MKKGTFRETLDRRIIDPDTRDRWITRVYMVFALLMLMHHVYITIFFAAPENGAIPFRFPWFLLACATVLLGRMWKDKCFWILLALLLIKILRVAIPMRYNLRETQAVYELCMYAFFICYGIGRVLNRRDREKFIALFCGLWTAAMAVYACFGLFAVLNSTEIYNLGNRSFFVDTSENRLWPIYHPVEGGTMTSLGIAAAIVGWFMAKKKAVRWLYIPAMVLMFLMGIFCSSRTSYILTAAGISVPPAILVYELLCKWKKQGKSFTALRLGAACTVFAALAVLMLVVQMKAVPVYNSLHSQRSGLISAATAETMEPEAAEETPSAASETAEPEEAQIYAEVTAEAAETEEMPETSTEEDQEDDGEREKAELNTRDFVLDQGVNGLLTGRWAIWVHVYDGFDHYPDPAQ